MGCCLRSIFSVSIYGYELDNLQHDSHIHGEYIIFAPNRDAESLKLIKQFNICIVQNSAQIKLQNNSIFDDGGHNDSAQGLTEN